jgi:hypothetical protein
MQSVILAYDTEKRLQQQGLAEPFTIGEWVYEAGTTYYDGVVQHVQQAIEQPNAAVAARDVTLYVSSRSAQ